MIGVTPSSSVAPDPVANLLASANPSLPGNVSITWTAPQGNAGGTPIPNQTVASYEVRYATFSVDSLAGNTTAWWNLAVSSVALQPPSYTPQPPGQPEAYAFTNLTLGATFYFAIKSRSQNGVLSPIDAASTLTGQQAWAYSGQADTVTPYKPFGITVTRDSSNQITFQWRDLPININGAPLTIDHYRVERYGVIGGAALSSVNVPTSPTQFIEAIPPGVGYYRVYAVSIGGYDSPASDYVDTSGTVYILATDNSATRAMLPYDVAKELLAENNSQHQNLAVRIDRRQLDETNTTLRSYDVVVYRVPSGDVVKPFAFSQPIMAVQLGFGSAIDLNSLPSNLYAAFHDPSPSAAAQLAQIVSIYWFNGNDYVRAGDPVLTFNQTLSINVRNAGIYQLRATTIGSSFRLARGSPYPRIITPHDPSQNNRVFFFFDNPTDEVVTGTIYDLRGAKVRDLRVDGLSPTANCIVWDGRDSNGSIAPTGIYLYKVRAGKESATGTVVVAE